MRIIKSLAVVNAALAFFTSFAVHAGESASLLAGAETYNLRVSVYADSACAIDQTAIKTLAQRQFGRAPRLREVAEQAIPDIILTITVDISAIPSPETPELCMYNVNARAIHPMVGRFRYSNRSQVIQAMTFNKSMFGVIVPPKVQEAVEIQSDKVLGMFLDEYALGNPRP